MFQSTLCYIEKDGKYLMLHRTKKEADANKGKWIGVGGKFLENESPEECLLREVFEETGLTLENWQYRGIVTFVSDRWEGEHMHLFTADRFSGTLTQSDEGELEWIDKNELEKLTLWEGDRIFLRLLERGVPFFSLKLSYMGDELDGAWLNGRNLDRSALLVSSCLLGNRCRYDGAGRMDERVTALWDKYVLIPVCPEAAGGLPIPRPSSEIKEGRVFDRVGNDVTEQYECGAQTALKLARTFKCAGAVLKSNSPSCGCGRIYDGSFSGRTVKGDGVTAALLKENGVAVYTENETEKL